MKNYIPTIAIVISCIALGFSAITLFRVDQIANEAVMDRERELVEQVKPGLMRVYEDFGMTDLSPEEKDPKTLDQAFGPLLRVGLF